MGNATILKKQVINQTCLYIGFMNIQWRDSNPHLLYRDALPLSYKGKRHDLRTWRKQR